MKPGRAKRCLLLVTGVLVCGIAPANTTGITSQPLDPSMAHSDFLRPPEVRLRKLHLVRPDLIPYPIEYEVVC
jgi:hypothetical protein